MLVAKIMLWFLSCQRESYMSFRENKINISSGGGNQENFRVCSSTKKSWQRTRYMNIFIHIIWFILLSVLRFGSNLFLLNVCGCGLQGHGISIKCFWNSKSCFKGINRGVYSMKLSSNVSTSLCVSFWRFCDVDFFYFDFAWPEEIWLWKSVVWMSSSSALWWLMLHFESLLPRPVQSENEIEVLV